MAKKKCVMFGLTTFAQMLRVYMERYSDVEVEAYIDRKSTRLNSSH